jgi:hypothetical protein
VNDSVRPERRKTRRPAVATSSTTVHADQPDTTVENVADSVPARSKDGWATGPTNETVSMLRRARSKGGGGGAILAGAMIGLRDALEGPKKEQIAIVVDAPTEPIDLDEHGIQVNIEDTQLSAPALPPLPERMSKPRRRRSR